jgi:hypothetical protein
LEIFSILAYLIENEWRGGVCRGREKATLPGGFNKMQ